jgi:hypothetical protein
VPHLSSTALQDDPDGLAFLRSVLHERAQSGALSGRPESRRRFGIPSKLASDRRRRPPPSAAPCEPLGPPKAAPHPGSGA